MLMKLKVQIRISKRSIHQSLTSLDPLLSAHRMALLAIPMPRNNHVSITRIRLETLIDPRPKAPFLEEPSLLLPHVIRSHMAPAIEAVLRPLLVETVVDGIDGNTVGPGGGDEVFEVLDGVVVLDVFEGKSGFTV